MSILLEATSPHLPKAGPLRDSENSAFARRQMERISRLLLIRLRSLGDCILILPLLDALHGWRRDLQLDVLVESPFAPVFRHHPAVHETLTLRPRGSPDSPGWSRGRAVWEIRGRAYPAVLNLHGGTTSLLYSLASGAPLRIGQESYRHSRAYNIRIPPSSLVWQREPLHTVEHQLTLMRWLDLPLAASPRASLCLSEVARARVEDRLRMAGVSRRGYFLLHPTATLSTKQWEAGKFARLADALGARYSLPVMFTSGPLESQVLLNIRQQAQERHHYWSNLDLEELFALIEGCLLFVGNDSGPTHAAAALGKPIVAVWGSSNFQTWRPWGARYEVVRSTLPCMPCPGYTCAAFGEPKCILDIPVEPVFEACTRLYEAASP